jgi:hypothetical protein
VLAELVHEVVVAERVVRLVAADTDDDDPEQANDEHAGGQIPHQRRGQRLLTAAAATAARPEGDAEGDVGEPDVDDAAHHVAGTHHSVLDVAVFRVLLGEELTEAPCRVGQQTETNERDHDRAERLLRDRAERTGLGRLLAASSADRHLHREHADQAVQCPARHESDLGEAATGTSDVCRPGVAECGHRLVLSIASDQGCCSVWSGGCRRTSRRSSH